MDINFKKRLKEMKKSIFILAALVSSIMSYAQFDGDGGTVGSKAISKTDESIVSWAKGLELSREANVTYGMYYDAVGKADSTNLVCVSLGNGGSAVATFDRPIIDGEGYDFVVFENAFDSTFMELAFVEVSSDGVNYFRFPSKSTATEDKASQTTSHYYNLAGRYSYNYGVGFDLSELEDNALLDKNNIRFVRLVDVVGGTDTDSQGNIIYEYNENAYVYASGFDLSGIGVINGGQKYKVADMEGLLAEENTYELASTTNYDDEVSQTMFTKNYLSGGLVFKGVAIKGDGYEMAIGWGPSNVSDTTTMKATTNSGFGWDNNYYVAASKAGVEGKNTGYLQAYYSSWNTEEHNTVSMANGEAFSPVGVYVSQTISSYIYEPSTPQEDLWFKIVAKGYKENVETATSEVYLRDNSEGGIGNYKDWRYLDLSALGEVDKIQFLVESNDVTAYIPFYMCLDNLTYKDNKTSSIASVDKDNNTIINIYPNPTTDFVNITTSQISTIRIMDMRARVVYKRENVKGNIQVNNLQPGTYVVSVVSNKGIQTQKLIVR